jgi:hypothetical protein
MRRSKILAVVLAATMAFSTATVNSGTSSAHVIPNTSGSGTPVWFWIVFGCAGGIVFTAFVANWQQRRQLTAQEAATCGILYYFTVPRVR